MVPSVTVTASAPIRSADPRPAARLTTMALLAVGFGVGYAAYSVRAHHRSDTHGFDLGIFEQIGRGYAAGGAPMVELKELGFHALGDHFHPILALLAPAYRLFPHTETAR
jgi:uncharacterized membrane protein